MKALVTPALWLCLALWAGVLACALPLIARVERRNRARDVAEAMPAALAPNNRVRAGAPPLPAITPPAHPVTEFLSAEIRGRIAREASRTARSDYLHTGRVRANPNRRHSREYAVWALEYSLTWERLVQELGAPAPSPQEARQ